VGICLCLKQGAARQFNFYSFCIVYEKKIHVLILGLSRCFGYRKDWFRVHSIGYILHSTNLLVTKSFLDTHPSPPPPGTGLLFCSLHPPDTGNLPLPPPSRVPACSFVTCTRQSLETFCNPSFPSLPNPP